MPYGYVGVIDCSIAWGDLFQRFESVFVDDTTHCQITDNTGTANYSYCSELSNIRQCEANYYDEICGPAKEYRHYGDGKGYYIQCVDDETGAQDQCFPASRFSCPDCPQCQTSDPGFKGCIKDSEGNRKKFGNEFCTFNGVLSGSTPCSVFDDLKQCLKLQCESGCGTGNCTVRSK